MTKPKFDSGAFAFGLAAIGCGVTLLLAPRLATSTIQPILAIVLAVAGTIGLILSLSRSRTRRNHTTKGKS